MIKLSFRVTGQGKVKGKRKIHGFNIELDRINKIEITEELTLLYITKAKEEVNKNIKEARDIALRIREIEETTDCFGTIETYCPLDDIVIKLKSNAQIYQKIK